jgi:general secretion pathway protein D
MLQPPAPTGLIFKWQGPAEVSLGEVFVATLELNSSLALRGMPLQVRFPGAQLQLLAIEEGSFFKADGAATSFTHAVDSNSGMASAGILRNQASGAQGQGAVVQVRLRAIKAGPAEVGLVSAEPVLLGAGGPAFQLPQPLRLVVRP